MKLKCVKSSGYGLTEGKIYNGSVDGEWATLHEDDLGMVDVSYYAHRFEVLPDETPPAVPAVSPYPDGNPKTKFGAVKPPLHLIPSAALIECAAAMALGAKKYGAYNWRDQSVSASVYIPAAERHLRNYLDGRDLDPESGAHELGHVMACCAILLDAAACGKLNDDRPAKGEFARLAQEFADRVKRGEVPALLPTANEK